MQHKGLHGKKSILKGGQRKPLCCNNRPCRCSPFDNFTQFSKEAMDNFIALAKILKKIHIRLEMEGWKINNGKFIRPDGTKFNYED